MSQTKRTWIIGESAIPIRTVYKIGRGLGAPGQYGQVKIGVRKKMSEDKPNEVAVKIIQKRRFARTNKERELFFTRFRTEVDVMRKMKHKNVIDFYEVYEDKSYLYIVMEACKGGELLNRISEEDDRKWSEKDARDIIKMVLEGIHYLHSERVFIIKKHNLYPISPLTYDHINALIYSIYQC